MCGVDADGNVVVLPDLLGEMFGDDEGETAKELARAWLADGDPVEVIINALVTVYSLSEREALSLIEYVS